MPPLQAQGSTSSSTLRCSSASSPVTSTDDYIECALFISRNSNELESTHYIRRSSDYAWQLFLAGLGILVRRIHPLDRNSLLTHPLGP